MTSITNILLRHNYLDIPERNNASDESGEDMNTIIMNLYYYGFALHKGAYNALGGLGHDDLVVWWQEIEKNLKSITGDDRKIDDFVVYKNFPAEVLEKSVAEYWVPQILMYWGFPSTYFTQATQPREKMNEGQRAIVLKRSKKETLKEILDTHLSSPARWKEQEFADILFLAEQVQFTVEKISFKENLVRLASTIMESDKRIHLATATDVLRLAVGLSSGDVSLREKTKFSAFKKPMRKFLLGLLEGCANLIEDIARRPEMWKKLLHHLHPGDYRLRFPNVCKAMDDLYHDRLVTFNSRVEALLQAEDAEVLQLLASRPGEFRRRLIHVLNLFGDKAAKAFIDNNVLVKLTTYQVVALRTFLASVNSRLKRVFPPKGNWNKLQVGAARRIEDRHIDLISAALGDVLRARLPKVKVLDSATKMIKLPNNGGTTSPFTRGTVFPIPDEVEFIRTASYWKNDPSKGNTWFDNGWNFFNKDWKNLGSCCWTAVSFNGGAVFSGDPVNSKEMQGRAAQLIDLYPSKLVKLGVRYAVWNILCFSRIPFSDAEDVFAALQWGKDPQKGKLFEPSRCQLSFPLTDKQMTKYVCLIDLVERKMVYLDANLHGDVSSADRNSSSLEKNMPPFMEYLDSLPSVHDLFCESVNEKNGESHILYSDKNAELQDVPAFVFNSENKSNKFTPININALLF